ncbi:winged helix-turn-helix transcriptional regulator [Nitratidesulfovibrio vulgaris]|jgi:DNA-binding HxlR family transcriptional regulator|uniref:Transcriptional regulator, putative n=2 Tax=Nitratidesulfovibrio vulgaris TaxID=881 RepID=Q729C8_NITV2|nr:helix-turn-helix domain-containing protein [Nitratidesulfovibrio vulgaris]GEB81036.1 transcriptional regulator [Desulfovibrio desulfuricans]HBW17314.1 transcriptional regulator [Desulfovibrio sp.]AAS96896.1 transcriptional regulator, putative [Nitratidesulfovibrio vulgaris str. Hildenborough]ABM27829.1 transcriptional regulator, HxlR family [Nitratidesulfovibrio vulgaris DP4]ADP87386.1 transcriptional regulator, HxlR family [Nitratidesulfovibrio vulgaris RCH1]
MKKTTARDADHRPCLLKHCAGKDYYCSLELTLQVIGGKWKPIILWRIGQDGVLRFSELRRILPNITQKMLTQQLRELEADGMVHREVYPQVPPRVEYSLTELGRTLMPVLEHLILWGRAFEEMHGVTPAPYKEDGTDTEKATAAAPAIDGDEADDEAAA